VLDLASSESPTYGEQEGSAYEGSAYNGHFGCTCYHPLFVFNQFGDAERCALRPGNMHGAAEWRAVLEPVIARYRDAVKRLYFRGDAAFANPEMYKFLDAERIGYTIRLPANDVLQHRIGYLLKHPVGRPPHEVSRSFASFSYQAQSWNKPPRVVAKVEWHPGELNPRVGLIVTNLARPADRVVAFYNQHGTCEQFIKEGKGAVTWTRLSWTFAGNAVRLQHHVLGYNLGNFMRTLAARGGGGAVADQPAREADQDRREGGEAWPLRALPDGQGRSLATDVRRNPVLDRPVAGTICAGVRARESKCAGCEGERHAAMQAKRCVSALRCRQLPAAIASCPRRGNLPLPEPAKRAILASKSPGIWRMPGCMLRASPQTRTDQTNA